jgi:hypothetical protein
MAKAYAVAKLGTRRFRHPADWTAEINETEDGWAVTLQSTAVSFAVVGQYPADQEPDYLADVVLDSLREEYPSLEVEELDDPPGPTGGVAFEATFLSVDTVVACWIRSWVEESHSYLVMVQSPEPEFPSARLTFRGLCRSFVKDTAS